MKFSRFILPVIAVGMLVFSSCDDNALRICFDADTTTPKVNQRVTFSASCSEGMEVYHWNFGDGVDSVTRTPTIQHTYTNAGYYNVRLHNTTEEIADFCSPNGDGRTASATIEVSE